MAYKLTFTTPIKTHNIIFKKDFTTYSVNISDKIISGTKEDVLIAYKKFLTSVGLKEKYTDIVTHLEIIGDFKLGDGRVFTFKEEE